MRALTPFRALLALGGLLVGAACDSDRLIPPAVTVALVEGVVTNGAGQPVGGVLLEAEVHHPTCAGGSRVGSGSPTLAVSDIHGRYRHQVLSGRPDRIQCVRLLARAADGTTRVVGEVTGGPFLPRDDDSLPYAILEANLVLP